MRAALASDSTGAAIAAVIHHRAATLSLVLPVLIEKVWVPSLLPRSMMVIGPRPMLRDILDLAQCPQGHRAFFRLRNAHPSGLAPELGF